MKHSVTFSLSLAATLVLPLPAQNLPDHSPFGRVLERVLRHELVDYAGLLAHRETLDAYLDELRGVEPAALQAAGPAVRLAFWINAYNACAMRLVVDHYPIEGRGGLGGLVNSVKGYPKNSIQQIPNTWKQAFCPVAGQDRSLDDIEHGMIRPMGDPRIHFAVNCASRSCPALAPSPYTADSLDEQLDAAVRAFVANPRHYQLTRDSKPEIRLNKVLDWYQEDFGGEQGVVEFLLPYLPEADAEYIRQHGPARLTFGDYDWTLNDTAIFGTKP